MKILKVVGLSLLSLILLFTLITALVINLHPAFGKAPFDEEMASFEKTGHYSDGEFINLIETSMDMSSHKMGSILKDYWNGIPDQKPKELLPVLHPDKDLINRKSDSTAQIIWFGHSAFLIKLGDKNILLDPMFGPTPAPLTFLGGQRFSDGLPVEIRDLPQIDLVIFSHDHYDHLDYPTMLELKEKTVQFFVPLGVGSHLRHWGISTEQIKEFDWWKEQAYDDLIIASTPARHFSGRGLTDRNSTLWSSWVIKHRDIDLYFSGDGGYGPHFKEIGEKYGPFDFAMMECGQYDLRWHEIHMLPEETAQAAVDIRSDQFMPIHWGSFVLALHSWYDPVERVTAKAKDLNQPILIPRIGEVVDLRSPSQPNSDWWKSLK